MKKFTLYTAILLSLLFQTKLKAQWTNGQNASYVIGQVNFTTTVTGVTDSTFSTFAVVQGGGVIDARHHVMYITDYFANRVLRYPYPLTRNSVNATMVFGQPNFTSSAANNGGLSPSSLDNPGSCTVDTNSGTLWVSDLVNNRILRFDSAFKIATNNPNADEVIGQINFTSNTTGSTASAIHINYGPITGNLIYYDQQNDVLWFADNENYRVLGFNNPKSLGNGPSANLVLGQSNFTNNSIGSGQNGFYRPDGLATIGSSLYVSDAGGNRILRFDNVMSLANGANASGVLGQINFTNNSSGLSQSTLNTNSGMASDASGALYVADLNNNRIMIFENANSLANGGNANFVLLQTNFTTKTVPAASQSTGGTCSTLAIDNAHGTLLALDRSDNRYLLFSSCGWINEQPHQKDTICSTSPITITVATTSGYSYQWQENQGVGFNNLTNVGIYSGVTTPSMHISAVSIGMNTYRYRCLLSGTCHNDTSSIDTLNVQICAGINEAHESVISTIYPNPNSGRFQLVINNYELVMNGNLEVYNVLGERIYSSALNIQNSIFSINMAGKSAGVYHYRVISETGNLITSGKFIIE